MSVHERNGTAGPRSGPEIERADFYDAIVDGYAAVSVAILDGFHEAFRRCEDEEQQQYIDIGCGPGSFTLKYLLPRCLPCRRLVAVDKRETMLKLAAEKYSHPNIEYKQLDIVGDVGDFVRTEGHFQRVYSFLMLQWVRDQRRAMLNVEKLLAPGGECLLIFERSLHFFDLFVAMMNSPRWEKYAHVVQDLIPATRTITDVVSLRKYTSDLVKSTKMVPLACEVFSFPTAKLWEKEKMIESFLSFNPVYALLNNKEKVELAQFTRDFTENLFANGVGDDENKRMILVIHAYKQLK